MKKMGKVLALVISIIFVFSLVACGSSSTSETASSTAPAAAPAASAAPAAPAKITVAGVVFQEDQFMKLMTAGYQAAAKDAGVECMTANTSNDAGKEAELINTYISQKVSGIAIAPLNSQSSVEALTKADQAGVKVAVTNINLSNAPFIVGGYTSDSKNIGETTGKAALKFIKEKLGGKANVAILQFKSQIAEQSLARVDGFKGALAELGDSVKYVADQDAWLQDKAVQVAGDILTANPNVNVIFAANDGGTIGATMAVKNAGKAGKVFVFGIDTGDQQLTMLKDPDNILQAITGQDPYTMGYNAMKVLIDAIKTGNAPNKGKTEIVPGMLLSRADPAGIDKFQSDLKARMGQ